MKLSIIIPIYNAEKYLKKTIESIIMQEGEYELILVDDGSKDASLSICNQYASTDHRVRVIHIENNGVSNARNVGIEAARGEYIQFVDSDDKLTEDALEKIFHRMESGVDVIVFSFCTFGNDKQEIRVPEMKNFSLRQKIEFLIEKGQIVSCWNKVYKKDVINTTRFHIDLAYAEDYCFNLEIFKNVNSVSMMSDVIYLYRREGASLSGGYDEKNFTVANFIRKESFKLLQQLGSDEIFMVERNYAYNVDSIIQRMIRREDISFLRKVKLMKKYCGKEYIEAVNRYYSGIYGKLLKSKIFVLVVAYLQILNRKKK